MIYRQTLIGLSALVLLLVIWQSGYLPSRSDCIHCQDLVEIKADTFQIGAVSSDPTIGPDEFPRRHVTIAAPYALARHQVTRGEFAAFVTASGYQMPSGCWTLTLEGWRLDPGANWQAPGFPQTDQHPVVCISRNDALAYLTWATETDGRAYRLPSEAEWHLAGTAHWPVPFWGTQYEICEFGNVPDLTSKNKVAKVGEPCDDGTLYTAPVGSFSPNPNGLFDMIGNVWEWTADCWRGDYTALPLDGSALASADCDTYALRGHSWTDAPGAITLGTRYSLPPDARQSFVGFRIAADQPVSPAR